MFVLFSILVNIALIPLLLVGVVRKVKARMQNRVGAPILQAFYDIGKLFGKGETISGTASWVFIWAPRLNLAVMVIAALLVPWSGASLPASWAGASNLLLVVYLLGMGKFASMLAAMDTGSAFGGLGASREASISLLVEPTLVVGLGALALGAGSTSLSVIYGTPASPFVAVLVGASLVVASLAELSRMPVDDPTTHLELTMVHEAMVLENSGRNLALVELSVALRFCIFFGLAVQTFLHAVPWYLELPQLLRYGIGLLSLFAMGALVAVAEGVLVKLRWRRVPNFVAFAMGLSLLSALIAVAGG
ncbi:MAG: respiratory chain complex I subunit 1 family protein [Armatimonadota bacterium]